MRERSQTVEHVSGGRGAHAAGRSAGACAAIWAIFLPGTVVCAVALGHRARAADTITLPNLLIWLAGLLLVLLQVLLLVGVTCRYVRGRRSPGKKEGVEGLVQEGSGSA
jgi:membrane protein implicated in regulation of membrane protease activity